MNVRIGVAPLAAAMLAACGPKAPGPDAPYKVIYAPHVNGPASSVPPFDTRDIYTPDLNAVIAKG